MTITAKYASTCTACSRPVTPGQQIEWAKGSRGVRHTSCGAARQPRGARATLSSALGLGRRRSARCEPGAGEIAVYRDSSPYVIGQTVLVDRTNWHTVTACGQYQISQYEDDCREGDTRYWAHVRRATETEAQTAQSARDARQVAKTDAKTAAKLLTTGTPQGRGWRQPASTVTIASEPAMGSLASKPYLVAAPDGTVYHICPLYDDDSVVLRLDLTIEQARETARRAGWSLR